MVRDGLASYGRFLEAIHQQCNFHLLTRCRELLEIAKGGAARSPLQVKSLLLQGLSIRDRFLSKEITERGLTILRGKLLASFEKVLSSRQLLSSPRSFTAVPFASDRSAAHSGDRSEHIDLHSQPFAATSEDLSRPL